MSIFKNDCKRCKKKAYKETLENWGGSFELKEGILLLEVTVRVISNTFRVSVWGNDDGGMEKYFDSEQEAHACFDVLMATDKIAKDELLSMGFDFV